MSNLPLTANPCAVDALATERLSWDLDDLDNIDENDREFNNFETPEPTVTLRLVLGSPAKASIELALAARKSYVTNQKLREEVCMALVQTCQRAPTGGPVRRDSNPRSAR